MRVGAAQVLLEHGENCEGREGNAKREAKVKGLSCSGERTLGVN